jgi:hypothetical protein
MHDPTLPAAPIRSSWNTVRMLMRGPLTDRKIEQYEKRGYYSAEFREARREMWQRQQAKRMRRDGNFLLREDGSRIYAPL